MAPRLTLISPDFTRLWFGQAVSSIGDMVFSTTLMLWVATVLAKDESWAPAAVSGVLVAGGTAVLVVGPIAGVFVDRWDKIRTMLGTEVLRGGLVALLAAVSFLPADALLLPGCGSPSSTAPCCSCTPPPGSSHRPASRSSRTW